MKIMLGGVPLGCDNIGDEAIVACVVKLLRGVFPDAEVAVCTREPEEAAWRMGVKTLPLYGFPPHPDWHGFAEEVRPYDAFIWFGATGLSDYPECALHLLDIAHHEGVKTVVWGVGMNSRLNPAFYRVGGKRRKLLHLMTLLSCHLADWVSIYENHLRHRTQRHIRRSLGECALVMLRDEESVREVRRCRFRGAVTGADSAILLEPANQAPLKVIPEAVRIGFCISAQNAVRNLDGVKRLWDKLLERPEVRIVLIPMNSKTDRRLMLDIAANVAHRERVECLESDLPGDVQACAGQCRLVVSSRLHLLILAANAGVPGLGIARGSKIANFLKAFGREPSGSVDDCDLDALYRQIEALLEVPPETLRKEEQSVMEKQHERLENASRLLKKALVG